MARATTEAAATRRQSVELLDLRGTAPSVIARALGSDYRTVKRDLDLLASERVSDVSLAAERHRLLQAARLVEHEAWLLFRALPALDVNGKVGCLRTVLAAQARCGDMVEAIAGLAFEARLSALEEAQASAAPTPIRRGGSGWVG